MENQHGSNVVVPWFFISRVFFYQKKGKKVPIIRDKRHVKLNHIKYHDPSQLKVKIRKATSFGENSKAVASRIRKNAAKEENQRRHEEEKEDEYWKDDDKLVQKKMQRKEQQEKKRLEQLQKKAELKNLLEKEDLSLKSQSKQPVAKINRAQILEEQEKRNAAATGKKKETVTHINKPLEENINRLQVDGYEARSITEAISILSTKDEEGDRHPEKRMKAAYAAFETANLPRIKAENPTLRLSQLKQILNKDWMRSPENPMNQKHL